MKQPKEIKTDFSAFSNMSPELENADAVSKVMNDYKKDDKKLKKDEDIVIPFLKKEKREFIFVEPSLIQLPSGGVCYKDKEDEDLDKGFIKIYPLTVREQEILSTSRYINEGTATCMVLNNCIGSNILADELLEYDYNYLLFYLRKISISDKYTFTYRCPSCESVFKKEIKISDITFKTLDKDFEEPIKVDLEVTNYTVLTRLSRVNDLRILQKKLTTMEEDDGLNIGDLINHRVYSIITDKGEELPKNKWTAFLSSLPLKDFQTLNDSIIKDNNTRSIMNELKCPYCKKELGGEIPITDDLFLF